MVDRSDSERLRGFGNGLTDGQTFAIVELLSRLKNYSLFDFVNKSMYGVCSSLCGLLVHFLIICFLLATVFTIIITSSLFLSVFVQHILAQLSLS